jgi:hypothetical protein
VEISDPIAPDHPESPEIGQIKRADGPADGIILCSGIPEMVGDFPVIARDKKCPSFHMKFEQRRFHDLRCL